MIVKVTEEYFNNLSSTEASLNLFLFMHCLLDRAMDKVNLIRAKALSSLVSIIEIMESCSGNASLDAFWVNSVPKDSEKELSEDRRGPEQESEFKEKIRTSAISRCKDSKATVRRHAVQLLEKLSSIDEEALSHSVKAIKSVSNDSYVSVRKQVILSASNLLEKYPSNPICCELWLQVILPACLDTETFLQNKSIELFEQYLLKGISSNEEEKEKRKGEEEDRKQNRNREK